MFSTDGRTPATIPAKMISEIPLPIPRSVICSPSHMMKAVPVVRVTTVVRKNMKPALITIGSAVPPIFVTQIEIPSDWTIESTIVP